MTHLKDKEIIKNLGITQEDLEDSRRRENLANQQLREREKLASRTGVSSKRAGEILKDKSRAEIQELENTELREQKLREFRADPNILGLEAPQQTQVSQDAVVPDQTIAPQQAEAAEAAGQQAELPEGFAGTGGAIPVTPTDISSLLIPELRGAAGLAVAFRVGGKTIFDPKKAFQAAKAIQWRKETKAALAFTKKNYVGIIAITYGLEKGVGFLGKLFNRTVDAQQQALNTLGQVTSTIVGEGTAPAGDWRKGIEELRFIRTEVIRLEQAIKSGLLSEGELKFNGKIIDVNADIYDQLATIDEGIVDLQSFALQGQFPELTPQQLQAELRQLEEDGIIKPIDLTTSRRQTTGKEVEGLFRNPFN